MQMSFDSNADISALLKRALTGDGPSIEELLALHDSDVRASIDINPKWRSVIDTEDILQVTYIEAVLDLASYHGEAANFGAWLRAIARNNLRDIIRGLERAKRPHPDRKFQVPQGQDTVVWLWNELTGDSVSASSSAARAEIMMALEVKMEQLPSGYAEAVRLVHFHERSIEEAARDMGRTYGAVYLLLGRALDRLRQLLGAESQFFSA